MKFIVLPMEALASEIGQWTRYDRDREKEVRRREGNWEERRKLRIEREVGEEERKY